jgi:hypothetical protein
MKKKKIFRVNEASSSAFNTNKAALFQLTLKYTIFFIKFPLTAARARYNNRFKRRPVQLMTIHVLVAEPG